MVNIETKDGCEQPSGEVSTYGGQRNTIQPSFEYAGCEGNFSYYLSGQYSQSNTAFSSATPGPTPVHDTTGTGQIFGYFSYPLDSATRLSLLLSGTDSDNQLPNVPGLAPQYALAGVANPPSSDSPCQRTSVQIVRSNPSSRPIRGTYKSGLADNSTR